MSSDEPTTPEPSFAQLGTAEDPLPVSYLHRPGQGETILYLHGLGSTKEDFHGAWSVPEWSEHTLVAFDAPGSGDNRTRRIGHPLGVHHIVATAEALVAHLGLADLTVIGHSMGGMAGQLFAMKRPELVRRLVSIEGNLGPEDCGVLSRRVYERRFLGREDEYMTALERELAESSAPGFSTYAAHFRGRIDPDAFFDYCRSIVEYSDELPLLGDFIALDVPKLYVHGSENARSSHIPKLRDAGLPVCSVPGSDHFPAYSNPDSYYRCLVRFIEETRAPAPG